MNLEIKTVKDEGVLQRERLVIRVTLVDDIGSYLVCRVESTNDDIGISNIIRESFWFPDQKVKAGDLVVLYTKAGDKKTKKNKNGSTTYFYYWDLSKPIWHEPHIGVVLMEVAEWRSEILGGRTDVEDEQNANDAV